MMVYAQSKYNPIDFQVLNMVLGTWAKEMTDIKWDFCV